MLLVPSAFLAVILYLSRWVFVRLSVLWENGEEKKRRAEGCEEVPSVSGKEEEHGCMPHS